MDFFSREIQQIHEQKVLGNNVLIGHLDTGVDEAHSALTGKITFFKQFGYRGFVGESVFPFDSGEHGTHIAGLLVGNPLDEITERKSLGVAPSARLCSGMVIEEGNLITRILSGLDWLIECEVRVVNLALGVPSNTPIFRPHIQEMIARDMVVVCSIGNKGAGQSTSPGDYPEVISVGALDEDGLKVAPFSGSVNPENSTVCIKPDFVAPGVNVLSTTPGNKTAKKSGTSMATAQVSGLVVLLREAFPKASNAVIKFALIKSCSPCIAEQSHRTASGILRPYRAFELLKAWQNGDRDWVVLQDTPIEKLRSKKYIDPRLIMQLKMAVTTDSVCEVVFQFASWDNLQQVRQLMENHYQTKNIQTHYKQMKYAPIAVCQAPRMIIEKILAWSSVCAASACDIDRLL